MYAEGRALACAVDLQLSNATIPQESLREEFWHVGFEVGSDG